MKLFFENFQKITFIFVLLLAIAAIGFMAKNLKVKHTVTYHTENIPDLCFIFYKKKTNSEIIEIIKNNPNLLSEYCLNCSGLSHKIPLVTAILAQNDEIIVAMIKNGASVGDAVNFFKSIEYYPHVEYLYSVLDEHEINYR